LQAAEERKRDAESKRAKAAVAKVKQAEKVITSASSSKPSRTISLFGFGNVKEVEQQSPDVVIKQAPRGVPIIKSWKLNRDGSVSGFISGSPNYDDGEVVTTSKIKGSSNDIVGGSVVQTGSGSRYYLDPKTKSGGGGLFSRNKVSKPTKTPSKQQKASPPSKSKPIAPFSRTTSIFSTKNIEAKKIPPGVPRFVNWKKNRDNSITGFISGSPNFPEGDRVSTSPITVGDIEAGEVVRTSSGSKYYLV